MTAPSPPAWDDARAAAVVQTWGLLFGRPVCTILVAAPAAEVLPLVVAELRRGHLRVRERPGRIQARSSLAMVLNLVQLLNPAEFFSSAVFEITVLGEGPGWVALEAGVRSGSSRQLRGSIPAALNRAVGGLRSRGVRVDVGPWDRWSGKRRIPA